VGDAHAPRRGVGCVVDVVFVGGRGRWLGHSSGEIILGDGHLHRDSDWRRQRRRPGAGCSVVGMPDLGLARWAGGTEGMLIGFVVLLLSTSFGFLRLCRTTYQGGGICSTLARSRMPGQWPVWWEPCGLVGEPKFLVLAGAIAMWLAWCLAICVPWVRGGSHVMPLAMFGWWRVYAERKLLPWISRATTAAFMDAVPFLKASLRLLPAPYMLWVKTHDP
jgi:hypothetical protein